MTYIVVGIAIWLLVGIAVALLLGKAMKLAENRENRDRRWRLSHDAFGVTVTRR